MGLVLGILAITAAVVFGGAFAARAGFRWLVRVMEKRQRQRLLASSFRIPEIEKASFSAPIWVAAAQFLLLLVLFGKTRDKDTLALHAALCLLLGLPAVLVAFTLHGLPQHRRTVKYVALWMGSFALAVGIFIVQHEKARKVDGWPLAVLPLTLLAGTAVAYIVRERVDTKQPQPLAFLVHRLCMILGPAPGLRAVVTFFAMRNAGIFPGYLVLRYFVRPYIASWPFLYLRSFHDHDAQAFLGRVLAPSAGARGVVVGLIHEQQTGEVLHRQTDRAWHAEVFALPDAEWQRWVLRQLEACAGVVIDISVITPSVRWELEHAMRALPPSRILVVSRTAIPDDILRSGVQTLVYSLTTKQDQRDAKTLLLRWVDRALQATVYGASPPQVPLPHPGLPLLCYAALALWAGIAVCIPFVDTHLFLSMVTRLDRSVGELLREHHVWVLREAQLDAVAALVMIAAASLFPLSAAGRPFSRAWFVVPCVVIALASLLQMDPGEHLLVESIKGTAFFVLLGYMILSCLDAHAARAGEIDLERLVLSLLAPAAVMILHALLAPVVMLMKSPGGLWLGAIAAGLATLAAAYAMIVFVQLALDARARTPART